MEVLDGLISVYYTDHKRGYNAVLETAGVPVTGGPPMLMSNNTFQCLNGIYISSQYKCDGHFHCSSREDEENCKIFSEQSSNNFTDIIKTNFTCGIYDHSHKTIKKGFVPFQTTIAFPGDMFVMAAHSAPMDLMRLSVNPETAQVLIHFSTS